MSLLNNAGLGKRILIEKWLEGIGVKNYIINSDLTIDVMGSVNLSHRNIICFPEYIQFNEVSGYFDCSHNNLISLKGCPKKVSGLFDCSWNNLTSLEYGPIGELYSYYCNDNNLTSLIGCPEKVIGTFTCGCNFLTSLEGCPKYVGEMFGCSFNKRKFSKKEILAHCDIKNTSEIYY